MDPHKCLSRCLVSSLLTLSLLSMSIPWDFPTSLAFDVSIMPTEVYKRCTVVTQNWTCALPNIWVLRCFDFLQSCLDAIYTSVLWFRTMVSSKYTAAQEHRHRHCHCSPTQECIEKASEKAETTFIIFWSKPGFQNGFPINTVHFPTTPSLQQESSHAQCCSSEIIFGTRDCLSSESSVGGYSQSVSRSNWLHISE